MKTFKIINDDLVINKNGELEMIAGREEEAQSIERILTTNLREFFLDPGMGLDYEDLRDRAIDEGAMRLALVDAITQDGRVKSVELTSFVEYKIDRTADVRFKVKMKDGSTIESEVNL